MCGVSYILDQEKDKQMKKLEEYIRSIVDFPEKGIIFRDITSMRTDLHWQ